MPAEKVTPTVRQHRRRRAPGRRKCDLRPEAPHGSSTARSTSRAGCRRRRRSRRPGRARARAVTARAGRPARAWGCTATACASASSEGRRRWTPRRRHRWSCATVPLRRLRRGDPRRAPGRRAAPALRARRDRVRARAVGARRADGAGGAPPRMRVAGDGGGGHGLAHAAPLVRRCPGRPRPRRPARGRRPRRADRGRPGAAADRGPGVGAGLRGRRGDGVMARAVAARCARRRRRHDPRFSCPGRRPRLPLEVLSPLRCHRSPAEPLPSILPILEGPLKVGHQVGEEVAEARIA